MKCQAPYIREARGTSYHNALVCGVVSEHGQPFENIKVITQYLNNSKMLLSFLLIGSDNVYKSDLSRYASMPLFLRF